MCKSGSSTTTQAPPDWLMNAYKGFIGNAQGLAGNSDPNSLVAGFTPDQLKAFKSLDQAGDMKPQQFSADAVNQYMSPYTSDVIKATEAQLNQQDAEQQSNLKGNIASAGAWGGDRSAVVQSQLAGQQDLANNSTIANLENSGYTQALNEFNQQQGMTLQEQQAREQAAEAQLGAGTLQQQLAQQKIDVPYQQMDWLAQMFGTLGPLSGGTSHTQTYTPFSIADGGRIPRLADGGVTRDIYIPFGGGPVVHGGGLNIQSPNTSSGKSPSASSQLGDIDSGLKDMGVNNGISGLFSSGPASDAAAAPGTIASGSSASPFAGMGGLFGTTVDAGAGAAASGAGAAELGAAGAAGAGAAGAGAATAGAGAAGAGAAGAAGAGSLADLGFLALLKRGGRTQGFDDGGTVDVDADGNPIPAGASALTIDQTPPEWRGAATNYAQPVQHVPMADAGMPIPPSSDATQRAPLADAGLPISAAGSAAPSDIDDDPKWENGAPVVQGAGIADAGTSGLKPGYYSKRPAPDPWMSVATGVLGALASRSLSKGALAGLQDYQHREELEENPTVDHSGATVHVRYGGPDGQDLDTGIPTQAALTSKALTEYRKGELETRQDQIAERAQASKDAVEQRREAAAQASMDRENALKVAAINASAGRYTPIPGKGVDENGKPVDGVYMTNGKTGQMEFRPGVVLTNKQGNFRSLPAMVAAKFQEENPNATVQDAENFAAAYTARVAGASNAGRGAAATAVNEGTVNNSIGILRKLIPLAASTGPITDINNFTQAVARHTNDADAINYKNAIDSISAEYARVMTGTTGGTASSDSSRREAAERILKGYNAQALPAVLDQMQAEMRGRSGSYSNVLNQMTGDSYAGPNAPGNSPSHAASQFHEGQILHQNGNIYKVINGAPVFQGHGSP